MYQVPGTQEVVPVAGMMYDTIFIFIHQGISYKRVFHTRHYCNHNGKYLWCLVPLPGTILAEGGLPRYQTTAAVHQTQDKGGEWQSRAPRKAKTCW